jgi:cysteine-rich repeat protein
MRRLFRRRGLRRACDRDVQSNYCEKLSHSCSQKNADQHAPCSTVLNGKCDRGSCVGCVDDSDCPGQACSRGTCMKKATCGDGIIDPGEQCDDGNASSNDACTVECKRNVCGDGHWNAGTEACDIGDRSSFADGRVWDTWSCDSACARRYVYTPCENRNMSNTADCPNGGCYSDGYCYPFCAGAEGSSCSIEGGRSGVCKRGWCWPTCTPGLQSSCPPRSPCDNVPDDNGTAHLVCDFPT